MEPATGMAAIISAVGSLVTGAIGWMGDFVEAITASGNEILLIGCVCVPLVGLGVGLLKRLISVRA